MSQTWVENDEAAGQDDVKTGLINLEDKLDTMRSMFSGTSFPTDSDRVVGNPCWRTDGGAPSGAGLYLLSVKDPTPANDTWIFVRTGTVAIADGGTGATTASAARTALGLGSVATENTVPVAKGGTGATDTATARTNLGLGSVSTMNTVLVANGGTGATTAAGARGNLGLGTLATKSSVAEADLGSNVVSVGKMKFTGTSHVIGTDGNTTPVEIPRTSLFRTFSGRKVSQLHRGTLNSNGLAVLTSDNLVFTIGDTTLLSPDYSGARSWNYGWRPVVFDGDPGTITKVVTNGTSGYALDSNSDVWSWGDNTWGQLGHGDTTDRTFATKISGLDSLTITDIFVPQVRHDTSNGSINVAVVWFLTTDGHVYGCGRNLSGELGDGSTTQRTSPVRAGTITGITSVVAGEGGVNVSVMALKSDGTVYSWGNGGGSSASPIGHGDTTSRSSPTLVSGLTGVDYIAMTGGYATDGVNHERSSFAADAATLKSFGWNGHGNLGLGNTTNQNAPQSVTLPGSPGNVTEITGSAGFGFSILRDANGALFTTGRNAQGQLGLGDTSDRSSFVEVTMPSGVTASKVRVANLRGDSGTTLFLGSDGHLWGCGNNLLGILSQGNTTDLSSFTRLKAPNGVTFTDFETAGSNRAGGNVSGVIALTANGEMYGSGSLATVGLGYPAMSGDTAVRESRALIPIPILA